MTRFLAVAALLLGMMALPFAAHAERSATMSVDTVTSNYVKKDKAYWTRVWYDKQVKRGNYVKRGNRYVKTNKGRKATVRKASARKSSGAVKSRRSASGRVTAKVNLTSQRMQVYQGGRVIHSWPVSSGRSGYTTPTGTWTVHRMHKEYYSKKYDGAPMPYAMFYHRGFAIHGTNAISRLGRPASHGCIRLHPQNAATLFSMIKRSGGTVKVSY